MRRRRRAHELEATLEDQREALAWKDQRLAEREQEILGLQWSDRELRHEVARLESHVHILEHSRSFKLTAPMRKTIGYLAALADGSRALRERYSHGTRSLRASPAGAVAPAVPTTSILPVSIDVGEQDPAAATRPGRPITGGDEERTAILAHPPCEPTYEFEVPARDLPCPRRARARDMGSQYRRRPVPRQRLDGRTQPTGDSLGALQPLEASSPPTVGRARVELGAVRR